MHHLVGVAEIAEILGVSRQRVAQLIETYDDFPKPEVELTAGRVWSRTAIESWIASHPERGPGRPEEPRSVPLFQRFTDRARHAVVKAQEEARLLHHDFIGTEHLVLGLVAIGEGVAFEALNSLGVTVERARDEVSKTVERGVEAPRAHIPFTPRGKKVLELALREALALGHNYIGTEHVLLAVLREKEGVGCQMLEALGLNLKHTRTLVLGLLSRGPAPSQKVKAPDADVRAVLDELRSKIEELERRLSD